jgi:hypothetical protein
MKNKQRNVKQQASSDVQGKHPKMETNATGNYTSYT